MELFGRNPHGLPGISPNELHRTALLLLACSAAWGQIGYPGPYPPDGYPGENPVPGIPLPGRGRKRSTATKDKTPAQPLPNFPGTLKRIDSGHIVLELDDFRTLDFKRTGKTKFFKAGEDAKPEIFKPGDRLSVEGVEDAEGYLTAVNVYWEKAGPAPDQSKKPESPDEANEATASTETAPPPAPPDPDDPGPPVLRRGKPPESPARREEPVETARSMPLPANPVPLPGAFPPSAVERIDETVPERKPDAVIQRAREAALQFTATLPNYICQEVIARYASQSAPASWRPLDVVTAEVVYEQGREQYRNLKVGGKPVKEKMEELSGAWSTGEFGTVLIDLFSPATAADFRYSRQSRAAGMDARVYDFEVDREHSHWNVNVGSQSFQPAYAGSVWVDPKTARVLRIEMQARFLPAEFPLDKVESAVDYEFVRLGGTQEFLLPVHSEMLSCQRGTNLCARNTIDFRNYHKYAGEATIEFEKQ